MASVTKKQKCTITDRLNVFGCYKKNVLYCAVLMREVILASHCRSWEDDGSQEVERLHSDHRSVEQTHGGLVSF